MLAFLFLGLISLAAAHGKEGKEGKDSKGKPSPRPKPGPGGSTEPASGSSHFMYYELSSSSDGGTVTYDVPAIPSCPDSDSVLMSMYILRGDLVTEDQLINTVSFNEHIEVQHCNLHASQACSWIGSTCGEVDVTNLLVENGNTVSFSASSTVKAICGGTSFSALVSFRCSSFESPLAASFTQDQLGITSYSEPIASSGMVPYGIVGVVIITMLGVFFVGGFVVGVIAYRSLRINRNKLFLPENSLHFDERNSAEVIEGTVELVSAVPLQPETKKMTVAGYDKFTY